MLDNFHNYILTTSVIVSQTIYDIDTLLLTVGIAT